MLNDDDDIFTNQIDDNDFCVISWSFRNFTVAGITFLRRCEPSLLLLPDFRVLFPDWFKHLTSESFHHEISWQFMTFTSGLNHRVSDSLSFFETRNNVEAFVFCRNPASKTSRESGRSFFLSIFKFFKLSFFLSLLHVQATHQFKHALDFLYSFYIYNTEGRPNTLSL